MPCSPDLSEEALSEEEDLSEKYPPAIYQGSRWGQSLVEVFSVRINNIDKENPGDLYGTIIIDDGIHSEYIYNQSIKAGDNPLLTGPAHAISACQSFTIEVLLVDKDNEEVCDEMFPWCAFGVVDYSSTYDRPRNYNIVGRRGSVSVNYIVLRDAVRGSIEVTLINGDGEDPANVYGELTATNRNFGDSKFVLFQKASDESINVSPGQLIPLSKSAVAVPFDSSLVVRANLYDHNTVSSNGEIANGTAEFTSVKQPGTFEEHIISGKIRVKVTWLLDWLLG